MKSKKGFTLIELLVVVAIMGLLATLAITALNTARARARDARRVADIRQIQAALELYFMDEAAYPTLVDDDYASFEGKCLGSTGFAASCSGTVYMGEIPANPNPRTDGGCEDVGYTYTSTQVEGENYLSYTINYCLGNDTGGIPAGGRIATPAGLDDQ
jgi:prepilin-type N-terminal cleavage/methylation domain-containing protein